MSAFETPCFAISANTFFMMALASSIAVVTSLRVTEARAVKLS